MRIARFILAALAACAAIPAQAAWIEASSRHFIVYADMTPEAITREANQLETLDYFLRTYHGVADAPELAANRLVVYVVPSLPALQRLYGASGKYIGGFYIPRAEGAVAFTPPRSASGSKFDLSPRGVLFHEYAHHFLQANFAVAYPAWFSEGYAEFVGTMERVGDQMVIGRAATQRAYGAVLNEGLSIRELFAPPERRLSPVETESIYSRGWLLTHYLILDAERRKKLDDYLNRFNRGEDSVDAATAAFGDLSRLNGQLESYIKLRRWPAVGIDVAKLPAFDIKLRALGPGEQAMIPMRMESDRGVNDVTGAALYARAAPVATRYPQDAAAQGWFAEMAYDAQKLDVADAAADRALAIDPKSSQALIYKARTALRRAELAKAAPGSPTWRDARNWILRANKVSNNDADALSLYYYSYGMAGETPTANSKKALQRALELVPQDPSLRYSVVRQLIVDADIAAARRILLPLAYDPHVGADSSVRKLLLAIDAKQPGPALLAIIDATETAKEAAPS